MTVTEFKIGFQKLPPKIVKNFDNENFRPDISKFDFDASDLEGFKNTIFCMFNKHVPIKRKYICANEAPFMTKELHKAIMKRFKLRNKFLKSKTFSDKKAYTSQHNFRKKLQRNTKRTYFNNLDIKKVTDNRTFWKTVVPLFSNKFLRNEKINLTEKNGIISTNRELSRVFSNFFSKAVKELKIPSISNVMHDESNDSLKEALSYFENHPSIVYIKRKGFDTRFTFKETNCNGT